MTATENERVTPVSIGTARSKGPSVQDFLAADTRVVPDSLLDHSSAPQGATDISKQRYVDPGFAALENEFSSSASVLAETLSESGEDAIREANLAV